MSEQPHPQPAEIQLASELPPNSLISITSIRLTTPEAKQKFANQMSDIKNQLKGASGLLAQRFFMDPAEQTYYTATAWKDLESMQAFANESHHQAAAEEAHSDQGMEVSFDRSWKAGRLPNSLEEIKEHLGSRLPTDTEVDH